VAVATAPIDDVHAVHQAAEAFGAGQQVGQVGRGDSTVTISSPERQAASNGLPSASGVVRGPGGG